MTPYRVLAFTHGFRRGRQTAKVCKLDPCGMGYVVWNPDHTVEPSRLAGSGTFLWSGLHASRRAAMRQFEQPAVYQVQIRTNQDRTLYIWNRHMDGRITGYWVAEERMSA